MAEDFLSCYLCTSEKAIASCICFKEIKYIGASCVSKHLTSNITSHVLTNLSLAPIFTIPTSSQITITPSLKYSLYFSSPTPTSTPSLISSSLPSRFIQDLQSFSYIQSSILKTLHNLSPSSNYGKRLYYIHSNAREIISYNSYTKTITKICPSQSNSTFFITAVCEMPSGDLILCGFYFQYEGIIYLYNRSAQSIRKLTSYLTLNAMKNVLYHSGFIYLFRKIHPYSGRPTAERYNININTWERMPNISNGIIYGIVPVSFQKIYAFFGGSWVNVLDTRTKEYRSIRFNNAETSPDLGFVCRKDAYIYILSKNFMQVFDLRLRNLFSISIESKNSYYSYYTPAITSSSIYFYNISTDAIYRLDTSLLSPYNKPRTLAHYAANFNSRYIYSTPTKSSILFRFDTKKKTATKFSLSEDIFSIYDRLSICPLPSGEIMITSMLSVDSYLLDPSTFIFTKLKKMKRPRRDVGIVYANGYVYTFGGLTRDLTDFAERFSLEIKKWEVRNSMICLRVKPACVEINNRIFIICGESNTMEVYDIERDCYRLADIVLEYNYAVAGVIDDRVHIIFSDFYKVIDRDLDIAQQGKLSYCNNHDIYAMGNTVIRDHTIYFYNNLTNWIEFVNFKLFKGGIELFTELYDQKQEV
jgi:hypothetical protein